MGIEIERKYLIKRLPDEDSLLSFNYHEIEQGYLNISPAIRVRREDDTYYMTYKGGHAMAHTEYNLPLDEQAYRHMVEKADGNIIRKRRYLIPLNEDAFSADDLAKNPETAAKIKESDMKIELDVFAAPFEGRVVAEIEFPDEAAANIYNPADWFEREVTGDRMYSNAVMSGLQL